MRTPCGKLDEWADDCAADTLPTQEALARLYELCNRYGDPSPTELVGSASQRHRERTGHKLSFGCCQDQDTLMAAIAREERRLLRALERELYADTALVRPGFPTPRTRSQNGDYAA